MRTPHPASRIKNQESRIAHLADATRHTQYDIRHTTYELFVQTNPISKKPAINAIPFSQTTYENIRPFGRPKTNPNEPKQSQSDPRFSPVMAPQSQNEPKRTQTNPNEPKQTQTKPIYRGEAGKKPISNAPGT
jgi:hypothetical protein